MPAALRLLVARVLAVLADRDLRLLASPVAVLRALREVLLATVLRVEEAFRLVAGRSVLLVARAVLATAALLRDGDWLWLATVLRLLRRDWRLPVPTRT